MDMNAPHNILMLVWYFQKKGIIRIATTYNISSWRIRDQPYL